MFPLIECQNFKKCSCKSVVFIPSDVRNLLHTYLIIILYSIWLLYIGRVSPLSTFFLLRNSPTFLSYIFTIELLFKQKSDNKINEIFLIRYGKSKRNSAIHIFELYCHLPYSRNVQEGTAICKWISWSFYSLLNAQFSGKGFWHDVDLKKSGDSELSFQPLAASAASPGRGRTYLCNVYFCQRE